MKKIYNHSLGASINYVLFINQLLLTLFLASGDFARLLITFANSLDPDLD